MVQFWEILFDKILKIIDIEKKKSHAHLRPCFLTNHDKNVNIVRGSSNNYFCKIILKSDHWLMLYDFFSSFSNRLPWQPEFFMDFISFNYFEKNLPKEHSCEVWLKLS